MLHWVRLLAIPESEIIASVDEDGISWDQGTMPKGSGYIVGPKIPSWSKLEGLEKSIRTYGLTCKTMEMLGASMDNGEIIAKAEEKVLVAILEGL